MKAITLYQPWASLIACGAKKFETRSWSTSYRGLIAIHAATKNPFQIIKGVPDDIISAMKKALREAGVMPAAGDFRYLPSGVIVATARLAGCWEIHGARGRGASSDNVFIDKYDPDDLNGVTMIAPDEYAFGDYTPGRFAWELADVRVLDRPVPAKGKQGLWTWNGNDPDDEVDDLNRWLSEMSIDCAGMPEPKEGL